MHSVEQSLESIRLSKRCKAVNVLKHLRAVEVKKIHKLSDSDLSSGPLAMTMFLARRKEVPSELEEETRIYKNENQ